MHPESEDPRGSPSATPSRGCLYALLHAPRERHEVLVRELIGSVSRELRGRPGPPLLFFGRYNKPDWHLRLAVAGHEDEVDGPIRALVEREADRQREAGRLDALELGEYEREVDRFGGEEGVAIAERIFHHDTLACLDWIGAEAEGRTSRSRREHCLIMTERYLDLMRLSRERRIAFYRHAYSFEVDLGRWGADDLAALERHYRSIRDGLLDLFRGATSRDPEALWGGAAPAAIAGECLASLRPLFDDLLRALADGRVRRNPVDLAWSLTHMHANRLQVEADAEAIVRFFMHRLHEEEDIVVPERGGTAR